MPWLLVPAIYCLAVFILPFPNWTSYRAVFFAVMTASDVTLRQKASMLRFLLVDLIVLPVWGAFWLADEIFFSGYNRCEIRSPVFIISQPRSGTTFLLRTLSEDKNAFLSVKHLEWRYPYISFWRLINLLGLRSLLEEKSYWPDTALGQTCQKIHHHVLGNYEEFGIFLEERFYHHYFVFRRFPFPAVLERVSSFEALLEAEKERMISTFLRVVKKVYFYRGNGEIFLTKENENVEFCRTLINRLEDARILMICRDPTPMLNSYLTMSLTCTEVKHGVDPTRRYGWHDINIAFRRDQCRKFVDFWQDISLHRKAVLITFHDLTVDVLGSVQQIYGHFGLNIGPNFLAYLEATQTKQEVRDKGYVNLPCSESGFEFYRDFVGKATQSI